MSAAAISSMTGFARVEGAHGAWSWVVEARSVNGRTLEVRFRGPPGFDALERQAREGAQRRFERGQVGLTMQARRAETAPEAAPDDARLALWAAAARKLVEAGAASAPPAHGLLALPGVVRIAEPEAADRDRTAVEAAMTASLEAVLDAMGGARHAEGVALAGVLTARLAEIEALVARAAQVAAEQPRLIQARYAARLRELAGEAASEDRIVQEAAAMAVRVDIQEELDRLTAHVAATRDLLARGGAAGRRLDFLAQEFMREANTLTSKSASSTLTAIGLDLKVCVDRLREQAANVE